MHPNGFAVEYRNPGHWDVYGEHGRLFTIRGEPGDVVVHDERFNVPRAEWSSFKTVDAAMAAITAELMYEE